MKAGVIPAVWRVRELLDIHGLSAYRLAGELHGIVSRNSVYAIAAGTAKRVDLDTLGSLVIAMRTLTNNAELDVGDLLALDGGTA